MASSLIDLKYVWISVLFLILAFSGARSKIIQAIPMTVKQAGTVGLGIFIAFVSFKNSGIIVPDDGLFIAFGGFNNPNVIIAFFGLLTAAFFLVRKNQYAVFLGMIGAALCGLFIRFGVSLNWFTLSESVVATLPQLPKGSPIVLPIEPMQSMLDNTFLVALTNLPKMLSFDSVVIILTFLFLDFFGTATTLAAAATQVSEMKSESFEDNTRIYSADALGTFFEIGRASCRERVSSPV